jgi:hypothetical protein
MPFLDLFRRKTTATVSDPAVALRDFRIALADACQQESA